MSSSLESNDIIYFVQICTYLVIQSASKVGGLLA